MHPYPESLPTSSLLEIVSLVRTRTVKDNQAVFANNCWEIIGFGLKLGFGDPTNPNVFGDAELPPAEALDDCAVALISCKSEMNDAPQTFGTDDAAIDPLTVITLIEVAMKVLAWIKQRRNK